MGCVKLHILDREYYGTEQRESCFTKELTQKFGVQKERSYPLFGEALVMEHTVSRTMPFKFSAHEFDSETGLYYMIHRYYDPKTAIFYGIDPLAEKYPFVGGYVYCFNNPIRLIDPDGRDPREAGRVLNVDGRRFNVKNPSNSHTGFRKRINDVEMWNKFDTYSTISALAGFISKSKILSALLEKTSPDFGAMSKKLDRFLDAAVSDKYFLEEFVDNNRYIFRQVENMGKGFESEVSVKMEYFKNKHGDFEVEKITHFQIVNNQDYGKKEGRHTDSKFLYQITTYEYNGSNVNRRVEYTPAIPRENNTNY